jgi:hypothetical protein
MTQAQFTEAMSRLGSVDQALVALVIARLPVATKRTRT